jgi:hypothetical protein
MGLDVSHGCWHGAYSAFHRWRVKLAEVAGFPPLELMEYFFEADSYHSPFFLAKIELRHAGGEESTAMGAILRLEESLPIPWACLGDDPLVGLLTHEDSQGDIPWEECGPLGDRLAELVPLMPDESGGGHIGNWREKTKAFADGLLLACEAKEDVIFG